MTIHELYEQLASTREATPAEDELVVEIVLSTHTAASNVQKRLIDEFPKARPQVASVFASHAESDRFFFVRFSATRMTGAEAKAFEFARELKRLLHAEEVNPIPRDSLYGAAAAALSGGRESAIAGCETPRRDDLPKGWVHHVIKSAEVWQSTKGEGVRVAVIDTGYADHVELHEVVDTKDDLNLVEGGDDASDRFSTDDLVSNPGHGTLVCSVVASRGDVQGDGNTSEPGKVTGSAPGCKIVPIRAIRSVVAIKQSTIPPAINHAVSSGCDVIAMALGGPSRVRSVEEALRRAVEAGVVVVAAAGNCWPFVVFPAAYSRMRLCVAVAALDEQLRPWKRTGRGPAITISAPGVNVWGAWKRSKDAPPDLIGPSQGTTLATSLTTGVAALWVAHHGGRQVLAKKAKEAGVTVQELFMRAVVHGISPPPVWNGERDLGAGVLDASKVLSFPLPTNREPRERMGPQLSESASSTSTLEILRQHAADYCLLARDEVGSDLADVASELIWNSYQRAARIGREREGVVPESMTSAEPSVEAMTLLKNRPQLRMLVTGR